MAYRQHRPARPSALGAASPVLPPVKAVGHAQSYSAREHHHAQHTQQHHQHTPQLETHQHQHHHQEWYTPNQTRSAFASSPSHAHAHAHAHTTAHSTPNTTSRRAKPRVTFASSPPSDYRSSSPLSHAPQTSYARGSGYSDRDAYGYGDRYGYSDKYGYGYEERYAPSERHALRGAQIRTSPEIGADGALRGVGEREEWEGSWGYRREYGYGYDYEKDMGKERYSMKTASYDYTSCAPRSYSPAPINTAATTTTLNSSSIGYRPQPPAHLPSDIDVEVDIEAEYPPSSDFDPDLHWDSEPASTSDGVSPLLTGAGSRSASSSSASDDDERVISGDAKDGKMKMDGDDDQDADEDGGYEHGSYGAYGPYGYESGGYGPYESTRTTFFRVSAVRGQWRSDPRPPVLMGVVKAASVPVEVEAGVGGKEELGLGGLGARTISEPAPATSGSTFLPTSGASSTSGTSTPTPVTPVTASAPAPVPSTSTATSPTTTTMRGDRAISDKVGRINGFSSEDTSVSSPTAQVDAAIQSAASEDVSAAADITTDGAAADIVIEVERDPNPSEPDADAYADLPYNSPLTSSDTLPSLTSDDHERDSSSDPLDSYAPYHYGVDMDMPSSPLPPSSPPLPPSSSPVLGAYAFEEEKERDGEMGMGMLDDDKMSLDGDVDVDVDVEEGMADSGNTRGSSPLSEVPDEDEEEESVPVVVKERSVSVATSTARVPMDVAGDVVMEEAPRRVNGDKPVEKISAAPKPKPAANDTATTNAKGKTKAKLPSASAPLKDNNGAVRKESVSVSVKKERVQVSLKKELKKEKEKEKVAGKRRRVEEDWDWEEEENENEAEETRVKPAAPVRKRKKQQEDRDRESSSTPSVAAASSSSTPPVEHPAPTKKPTKSRRANPTNPTTSSKSRSKRRSSSPSADLSPSDASIRPTDSETQALHAQVCGMLIQAMSTSRASSLPLSTLAPLVLQSQPALSSSRSFAEWVRIMDCVLHAGEASRGGSGVFGKVESSGAVDCGEEKRRLEGRWFYVPELDEDQERAGVVRAMMPRPAKRSETKKYKQYYWRPLKKISMWDAEDAL